MSKLSYSTIMRGLGIEIISIEKSPICNSNPVNLEKGGFISTNSEIKKGVSHYLRRTFFQDNTIKFHYLTISIKWGYLKGIKCYH